MVLVAHWQTAQAARLFQCRRAPSNAVNAYPMLNVHGINQKNAWFKAVRIRHFGRHKCRAPALAEDVTRFLAGEMKGWIQGVFEQATSAKRRNLFWSDVDGLACIRHLKPSRGGFCYLEVHEEWVKHQEHFEKARH